MYLRRNLPDTDVYKLSVAFLRRERGGKNQLKTDLKGGKCNLCHLYDNLIVAEVYSYLCDLELDATQKWEQGFNKAALSWELNRINTED